VAKIPEALPVAEASLRELDAHCLQPGLCHGGVGDALSVPDSESAAALLESAMLLHAVTGSTEWIPVAERAAHNLATWVMDDDVVFPEGSEFARLGMRTTGTVFANVQNKHSAPGICTHSGAGLFRLYRATGDSRYMDLLYAIAGAIPQHVSRKDRPIHAQDGRPLPSGWINERVNTSDWDDNVGGVFYGSCWCEISMLLSVVEIPGIYVDKDSGAVWSLEPFDIRLTEQGLVVKNPTQWNSRFSWMAEGAGERSRPHPLGLPKVEWVDLAAGSEITVDMMIGA
jgi:hypothetical protein